MITLITGSPGAGKTAWTVQEMTRLPSQRKLFVHGVKQLRIAHEPIYCKSELCDLCRTDPLCELDESGEPKDKTLLFVENWPDWATTGSLIIIDEVQRIWRPSNAGSKIPDGISRLETHRHRGLDFWLISQGPHLFHSNIRRLIGRHIHLLANWRGRSEYEFPECRDNVTSRQDAVVRPYKLPSKIFSLYHSAEIHTKQKHRKPVSLYVFGFILFLVLIFGYRTYTRIRADTSLDNSITLTTQNDVKTNDSINSEKSSNSKVNPPGGSISSKSYPDFIPVVANIPASAPAYASIVKVTDAPVIIGCVKTPDFCRCYSRQAVPMAVSYEFCQTFLDGKYFNPFRQAKDLSENYDGSVQNIESQQEKTQTIQGVDPLVASVK